MSQYILMPDSFKGSVSSLEVCAAMERAIRRQDKTASIRAIPIADGGEGTADAFLTALGGEKIKTTVSGPFLSPIEAAYGKLPDGTAVIEMAACAGLPLVGEHKRPHIATTYGVGELIAHAVSGGASRIILGLGGSATNDGGCGMAAALGIRFCRGDEPFIPTGETLTDITRIDSSFLLPELKRIPILAMCDVDNPLCGKQGAAAVFGPQKGAHPALVRKLDQGLAHLAQLIERDLGLSIAHLPGAGAAGGMGGGAAAFLHARLESGISILLDQIQADTLFSQADYIFTGEGRFDRQSLRGKTVIGIARKAKESHTPVIVLAGSIDSCGMDAAYDEGVTAFFPIHSEPLPDLLDSARSLSAIERTMTNVLHLLKR